jgi:hypothetical protein
MDFMRYIVIALVIWRVVPHRRLAAVLLGSNLDQHQWHPKAQTIQQLSSTSTKKHGLLRNILHLAWMMLNKVDNCM